MCVCIRHSPQCSSDIQSSSPPDYSLWRHGVRPAAPTPPRSAQKSIIFQDLCMCIISNNLSHGTVPTTTQRANPHIEQIPVQCGYLRVRKSDTRAARTRTDAPINGNTFPSVNERSQLNISITIGVETKNSSDLSSGGPPMSESDEFFVSTPIVIEIWAPQLFTFSKEAYHLSEHQSMSSCSLPRVEDSFYVIDILLITPAMTLKYSRYV